MRSSDIRDIKGLITPDFSSSLVIVILCLAILTGLFLFFFFVRRRKKRDQTPPPHEIALAAIEALKSKGPGGQEKVKEYYADLSHIIRRYLRDQYCFASEMTTEECLFQLENLRELSSEKKDLIRDFLIHCDLVKFAERRPSPVEIEDSFRNGQRIIDLTKGTILQ